MPTPTASEIIERVKARYAGCRSYEDTGEQTTHFEFVQPDATHQSHTGRMKFRTAYERGGRFIFDFSRALLSEPEPEWPRSVVWGDGTRVRQYSSIPSPWEPKDDDLDHALAGFTGVSGGVASTIPPLLFGKPNARIGTLGTAAVWPAIECEGAMCIGLGAAWPTRNTKCVVWIDETAHLVRKVDEEATFTTEMLEQQEEQSRRVLAGDERYASLRALIDARPPVKPVPFTTKTTTIWRPRMDHAIDPKVFEFVPPG